MTVPIELVSEQLLDCGTAKLTGWQADAMQDDQVDLRAGGPLVLVWARTLARRFDDPGIPVNDICVVGQSLPCLR